MIVPKLNTKYTASSGRKTRLEILPHLAYIANADFGGLTGDPMATRNVVLTGPQEEMIESLIEMGRFQNASEVIRAGLRLIEDQEAGLMEVRAGLLEGIAQADRGETIDGEEAIRGALRRAKDKRKRARGE